MKKLSILLLLLPGISELSLASPVELNPSRFELLAQNEKDKKAKGDEIKSEKQAEDPNAPRKKGPYEWPYLFSSDGKCCHSKRLCAPTTNRYFSTILLHGAKTRHS